ncbi:MAG: hypothetical protein HY722_06235 [Planctomycetes bacterium]|nr:hypothetical protein [Planctomycetota bacterium]
MGAVLGGYVLVSLLAYEVIPKGPLTVAGIAFIISVQLALNALQMDNEHNERLSVDLRRRRPRPARPAATPGRGTEPEVRSGAR